MIGRIQWKVITSLIVLTGIIFHSQSALAGIGVDPTVTELQVAVGHTKSGSFRVANGGEQAVTVKVEFEDWLKLRTGQSPMDVSGWLTMDETEFELEPAEIKNIGYHVMAPEGVEGELIAMVFFSSRVPSEGMLSVTGRFGVALYVGIEGTEVIDPEVADVELSGDVLKVIVQNNGNVHLRPSGRVLIKDPEGSLVYEARIPYTAVVFAGRAHTYPVGLKRDVMPPGEYIVEAIFDTGKIYEEEKDFKKVVDIYVE